MHNGVDRYAHFLHFFISCFGKYKTQDGCIEVSAVLSWMYGGSGGLLIERA